MTPAAGKPLVLASASPRRQELLRQIGLAFEVRVSGAEEDALGLPHAPVPHARYLATLKARDVAATAGTSLVLGADTIVVLDEHILGKPSDDVDALRMLSMLQGRTHQVITAVALLDVEDNRVVREAVEHVATDVTFRAVSEPELRAYTATGEPRDKAGAYAIQGIASLFIEGIRGDYFNVVGLPLFTVARMLQTFGRPVLI